MNFPKFLRAPLTEHLWWLLLVVIFDSRQKVLKKFEYPENCGPIDVAERKSTLRRKV